MSISEEYMSAHDVSQRLNIDRSYILALCRQGRFAGAAKIGNYWAIPRKSVEAFQKQKPGVKSRTKQQHEEDKAMLARLRESTNKHGNADVEICGD